MRTITYAQAFVEGLDSAMRRFPNLSLIGNEVLGLGPHRVHLEKIWKGYPDRVHFPPTSEGAFAALAAGAAMSGERVFCHLGAASFSFLAMTAIANEALDPRSDLAHPHARLLRHLVTSREQLDELDYLVSRAVAEALTGDRSPRAFRHLSRKRLRELGLESLVALRNQDR